MAEELRIFLRSGLYIAAAGGAYWIVSAEPAGTVLLVALLLALVSLLVVLAAVGSAPMEGLDARENEGRSPLATVARVIGFSERPDARAPFEARSELVPLRSAWPIVTAAAVSLIGLGFVFGSWLTVPGVALLVLAGIGWITQLDHSLRG